MKESALEVTVSGSKATRSSLEATGSDSGATGPVLNAKESAFEAMGVA